MINILNRFTDEVIFKSSKDNTKDAVLEALAAKADLSFANLSKANLFFANLSKANLSGAANITTFISGQHLGVAYGEKIQIGCIDLTVNQWLETFEKIGKENNYTVEQIKAYGGFIKLYAEL